MIKGSVLTMVQSWWSVGNDPDGRDQHSLWLQISKWAHGAWNLSLYIGDEETTDFLFSVLEQADARVVMARRQ